MNETSSSGVKADSNNEARLKDWFQKLKQAENKVNEIKRSDPKDVQGGNTKRFGVFPPSSNFLGTNYANQLKNALEKLEGVKHERSDLILPARAASTLVTAMKRTPEERKEDIWRT